MPSNENEIYPELGEIFQKRECCKFIPQSKRGQRCCCGRLRLDHPERLLGCGMEEGPRVHCPETWRPSLHSKLQRTDAYGTIEFQGGSHPIKAKYVRLSHDTDTRKVFSLLISKWKLRLPKLVMSIHGGKANFDLQCNLKKAIQEGLLKAAKTTEAWIFTEGTNSGVVRYVGDAFKNEREQTLKRKIATIGIAPWGIIGNRDYLLGRNKTVLYNSISSPKNKFPVLNDRHAFFLLVDDGTIEKYGCEISFRKLLEKEVRNQVISQCEPTNPGLSVRENTYVNLPCFAKSQPEKDRRIPIVAVVIEGGTNTIRSVLEYVTDLNPVPIVVCDGSGRAADLLAFTHKYIQDDGILPSRLQRHLLKKIMSTFDCTVAETTRLLEELLICVRKKELITIFRMGEGQELDQTILTVLLQGSGLNPLDQFALALAWNRVDIASSEIFSYGQEWTNDMLDQAMMEALTVNSVDFVRLLLENGAHMSRFLTIPRLEELYNTKRGPSNTLHHLIKDVRKMTLHNNWDSKYDLPDIGLIIEHLMGGAYRSRYRAKEFREQCSRIKAMAAKTPSCNDISAISKSNDGKCRSGTFSFPYNDLFIWAILTKRQELALFLWKRGQEAIAKALVAIKLYKRMAQEAEQDDLKADISEKFRNFSRTFENLALQLLDYSYRQNDTDAQKLLTCELKNWGMQTCLTLAVSANHRKLLAHPCCQILLADLWMGGLRTRKNASLKAIVGLFCPLIIPSMEFKSRNELKCMPQPQEDLADTIGECITHGPDDVINIDTPPQDSQNSSCVDDSVRLQNGNLPISRSQSSMKMEKIEYGPKFEQSLSLSEEFYEFYTSPLTKFLAFSISYFLFLCIFTYTVIIRMRIVPSWQELYCLLYIVTFSFEKFREIVITEPVKYLQKCVVWMDNKWNPCDLVAILVFYVAFVTRMFPEQLEVSRVIYACDIMYWYLRILHILSVNKYLGPFVTMIGKMVQNMFYFVVLLLVVLMAYGVARQGILHPYEDPSWELARNIFYKPYFMLYGEVFADSIDPPCGDGPELAPCRTGRWVAIIAMCLFLLVANILLINLLIAVFNNIFLTVDAVAQQVWKAKRYSVVMEYEQKPCLPPPLILINHIQMFYKFVRRRCDEEPTRSCPVLKLFLSESEMISLQIFEEQCVDGFFLEEENLRNSSTCELVKTNNAKVELLTQRVNDLYRRSSETVASLRGFKYTLRQLNSDSRRAAGYLQVIHRYMISQGEEILVDDLSSTDEEDFCSPQPPGGDLQDDHMDNVSVKSYCDGDLQEDGPWDALDGAASPLDEDPRTQLAFFRKLKARRYRKRLPESLSLSHQPPDDEEEEAPPDDFKPPEQAGPRRVRRISTHAALATGPNTGGGALLRRRSSARRSQRSTASAKKRLFQDPPPTPDPQRLVHEYTSITDEIETHALFNSTRQALPVPGHPGMQRRISHVSTTSLSEAQQIIQAKEEHLLEAEKQDYMRMEKTTERRIRHDSDGRCGHSRSSSGNSSGTSAAGKGLEVIVHDCNGRDSCRAQLDLLFGGDAQAADLGCSEG